jgi:hypothetical protein
MVLTHNAFPPSIQALPEVHSIASSAVASDIAFGFGPTRYRAVK